MEKKLCFFRWLMFAIVACTAIVGANAASVNISGLTPATEKGGIPVYLVQSSPITISSSAGYFNYVYIDGTRVAYISSSYWSSYSVDISAYLDGELHLLQLKIGSSDYGSCYFRNSNFESDGISYYISTDAATVVGCNSELQQANIQSSISKDGVEYPVTAIGSYAFSGCSGLTSITIPQAVTAIGSSAFNGCSALKEVILSDGDNPIQLGYNTYNSSGNGKGLFADCPIETLYLGRTYTIANYNSSYPYSSYPQNYGYTPFPGTIKSLTIGDKVTAIPNYLLRNGSQIETLTIPEAVTSIGNYAFNGCSALKEVILSDGDNPIQLGYNTYNSSGNGKGLFADCPIETLYLGRTYTIANYNYNSSYPYSSYPQNYGYTPFPGTIKSLTIGDKVTAIPNYLLRNGSQIETLTIPEAVTSIGNYAFNGCSGLTSITIPEAVTVIGSAAFAGCSGLTSITIPEAVTVIGRSAFSGCSELTSITFNATNCTACGSYDYPAFPSSISNLTLGSGVTNIPDYFLRNDSLIENITIPEAVTAIGSSAFSGCSGLTSITIPEAVTAIGSSAFSGCSGLTSITIPEAVTVIGRSAFSGCSELTSITFNATNCTACGSYDYPAFPSSISNLTLGSGVTNIPDYFLRNGSRIETLTIPNAVTTIGANAFYGATKLKSLTLGSGLLSIGNNAFSYNNRNIQIAKVFWLGNTPPANYSAITANINYVANDQYNFSYQVRYQFLSSKFMVDGTYYVPVSPSERTCDVIDCNYSPLNEDVVISDKVTNRGVELTVLNINRYSFYKNQNIENLTVNNNGYVGESAFANCNALTNIHISSKGDIQNGAFNGCDALETATVDNVGAIGGNAFYECTALNEVSLGNSITSVGSEAFFNCSSLPTITLPDNITAIGEYIFSGCSNLTNANIGSGISTIPNYSFERCSALNDLIIPGNVNRIGNYVFSGCRSLASLTLEENGQESDDSSESPTMLPTQTFDDWTSTNHSNNSTSEKSYSFSVSSGDRLSFSYSVDSESRYDFLIIKINGTEVVKESGQKTSSFTRTFTESGEVTLYLSYSKNYYNSSGQDKATVSDIILIRAGDLRLGSNGSSPLFSDCPLGAVYIGRRLSYNISSYYGYSPFYRNTSLQSVEITNAEVRICDNEFYGCTNLKTLKIGNGVKTIGRWAFSGCSSLDYFSAGYRVESIGEEAFSDCTGLKNYYSFSIIPPVCGSQALDDINKWECNLFVPAESSDEYQAADQWKDFFFVNETGAVLVERISLNADNLDGKTGDTFQLIAEILPANATRKTIVWSSTDPSVATIDSNGLVTFVKEGSAVITARSNDGSGVETSINIVVTVKEPELGDSNANGVVNIADAVNTANYAIGNETDHFNETAADVNQDGIITLADASATVALILEQPVQTSTIAMMRARISATNDESDILIIDDYIAKPGETTSAFVSLDNTVDYVALQADITVPQGLTLAAVNIGSRAEANHSLAVRRIGSRKMRIALFDINGSAFADNDGAILELVMKADGEKATGRIEIDNILASDSQAHEYVLTSTGGNNSEMSGIDNIGMNNIRIETSAEGINIHNAAGSEISIFAVDGTALTHFIASSDFESCKVVPGVYVVVAGAETKKVVVK